MPLNMPMILTWARIAMIPMVVGVFYLPDALLPAHWKNASACALFTLAAITDGFDGYLARKYGQITRLGAFLDPVADKLMVAAALIMLVQLDRADTIVAFIIIGREIAISALREWMAKIGAGRSVAVSFLGKVKTASQMVAIPMLLYHDPLSWFDPQRIGTWLIYLAALLTLWSMAYYLRMAWPHMAEKT